MIFISSSFSCFRRSDAGQGQSREINFGTDAGRALDKCWTGRTGGLTCKNSTSWTELDSAGLILSRCWTRAPLKGGALRVQLTMPKIDNEGKK